MEIKGNTLIIDFEENQAMRGQIIKDANELLSVQETPSEITTLRLMNIPKEDARMFNIKLCMNIKRPFSVIEVSEHGEEPVVQFDLLSLRENTNLALE